MSGTQDAAHTTRYACTEADLAILARVKGSVMENSPLFGERVLTPDGLSVHDPCELLQYLLHGSDDE